MCKNVKIFFKIKLSNVNIKSYSTRLSYTIDEESLTPHYINHALQYSSPYNHRLVKIEYVFDFLNIYSKIIHKVTMLHFNHSA